MARRHYRRDSRTADRKAGPSPFASSLPNRRARAAQTMIDRRNREIEKLNELLASESDPAAQKRLATRLLATTNNRNSWLDYQAEGTPKETRAVVVP